MPRAASFALLVGLLAGSCGGGGVPAELHAVPRPDLSRLPAPLREQVGDRWEALTERIAAGAPAAQLARAYGDAGLLLMAAEFEEAAIACLRNAEALAPDDPRWPYYLGQFHLLRGEQAEAPAFFERAHALRPTDVPTLLQLGEARLDQGRPDDAAARFREALAIEPGSAPALWGLGRALLASDA
ncbi:MAG: tetratricopeptide repeat protein, partial [Acidobacteria bacterium]|nr:tetratricopeptide repeat protein [Acidobacteriota bacterium]